MPRNLKLDKLEANPLPAELEVRQAAGELIRSTCKKIGMELEDYLKAIKNGLSATKTTLDKFGGEHIEEDHTTRLRAATMGLEVEGYLKKTGNENSNMAIFGDVRVYVQQFKAIK